MKKIYIAVFCLIIGLSSCAQSKSTAESSALFQSFLDKASSKSTGISMTVLAPELNINWTGASGYDGKKKDQKLKGQQPFRIASITKTFTAVSILRLAEMGKLNINDPIEKYISDSHKAILKLDKYDLKKITIKHCLQHVSGLFDYAVGNDDFVVEAMKNPARRWTRTDQIQFAVDHGDPIGEPGEKYHYSDTGYIILGEIIERLTGKGLAEGNKSLIDFNKLQLNSTWLESLESDPKGLDRRVRTYIEDKETTDWDNSVDLYGGGGYFSTTEDLAKFYQGLFNGMIYDDPATLKVMLSPNGISDQGRTAESYKMGIWEIKTPFGSGFMHNGFWDTAVIHFPDYNATIAINYVDAYSQSLLKLVFNEIVSLSKKK